MTEESKVESMEKNIELSLIIYPNTKSTKVKWPIVPRQGETIFYKSNQYKVTKIWHSMDLKEIKIFIINDHS